LKSVQVSFTNSAGMTVCQQGEMIVSAEGVEGNLIYKLSAPLRELINLKGKAELQLDLAPAKSKQFLLDKLSASRGKNSLGNHLRKQLGIDGIKAALLWELLPKEIMSNSVHLTEAIKALPLTLRATRPIEEAISSAGGVAFEALDDKLMIKVLPGVFCAGEMLDWEAPTGGYLLTACFASGRVAGMGVLSWLKNKDSTMGRMN